MRILVTAGPTREYIDAVRFISNASSGRMGYAVAGAAAKAGHQVTLASGSTALPVPANCQAVPFVSVEDLQAVLRQHFDQCDALVMAAAVGDFRPEKVFPGKIRRAEGTIRVRLIPTEDLLAGLAAGRRQDQILVGFAVEDGPPEAIEAKARAEMAAKGTDFTVRNTPAAMGAQKSLACILSGDGVVLPWATRSKDELAGEIVRIIGGRK